jgi:hypothetical protein
VPPLDDQPEVQPDDQPAPLSRAAPAWAETVLEVLATPYPWISGHVASGPEDCDVTPSRLHPAFHGSVDWHSSVHMQWSAVRLLALAGSPDGSLSPATSEALRAVLDERLTEEHGLVEAAYLRERPSYERPYGWAWAAMLAAEVADSGSPQWRTALRPLADTVGDHLVNWLPRLSYPVRHGVHANTAFALVLAHEAFGRLGRADVVGVVERRARDWYAVDRDAPVAWEPSGEDFLSPSLVEAELMRRVLAPGEYAAWLDGFLPGLAAPDDPLLEVPRVLDDSDGKAVHLHGLALSRAWLLRTLAAHLVPDRRERALAAADRKVEAVSQQIVSGDLMSTHWLVSFALLADAAGH